MEHLLKSIFRLKRVTYLLMIIVSLLILSSCKDDTDNDIEFNYEIIPYFSGFAVNHHEDVNYVFTQLSALQSQDNISNTLTEKYDEAYFDHFILVVMDLLQVHINASGPAFTVQQINQYESSLNIRLIHNIDHFSDVDLYLVYIFIEIDKNELNSEVIESVNTLHLNTEYYYKIQSDSPNSLLFMFSPSLLGEHKFQLAWNHEWFSGTLKMDISKDFNIITIYDMHFSEETPNIYDLPTEAQITNFIKSSQMTFIYG
ncbi:MAG: hypothetical protein WC964_00630, partial [Acholeplasmataceae bacterium]